MEPIEKNVNNDNHDQATCVTNKKRKQDEESNEFASKIFPSESRSLPFGIANVLQSTNESSKVNQTASVLSVNPWLIALQHLSSTVALANASNWCAKCSIQFRLTSELVHHIRVHHAKQRIYHRTSLETTTRKSRTNSGSLMNLTCQICCETFRERHHLTRHMTSHR